MNNVLAKSIKRILFKGQSICLPELGTLSYDLNSKISYTLVGDKVMLAHDNITLTEESSSNTAWVNDLSGNYNIKKKAARKAIEQYCTDLIAQFNKFGIVSIADVVIFIRDRDNKVQLFDINHIAVSKSRSISSTGPVQPLAVSSLQASKITVPSKISANPNFDNSHSELANPATPVKDSEISKSSHTIAKRLNTSTERVLASPDTAKVAQKAAIKPSEDLPSADQPIQINESGLAKSAQSAKEPPVNKDKQKLPGPDAAKIAVKATTKPVPLQMVEINADKALGGVMSKPTKEVTKVKTLGKSTPPIQQTTHQAVESLKAPLNTKVSNDTEGIVDKDSLKSLLSSSFYQGQSDQRSEQDSFLTKKRGLSTAFRRWIRSWWKLLSSFLLVSLIIWKGCGVIKAKNNTDEQQKSGIESMEQTEQGSVTSTYNQPDAEGPETIEEATPPPSTETELLQEEDKEVKTEARTTAYKIVTGSFSDPMNAELMELKISRLGYASEIAKLESLNRVSAVVYCAPNELDSHLQKIRSVITADAWILKTGDN